MCTSSLAGHCIQSLWNSHTWLQSNKFSCSFENCVTWTWEKEYYSNSQVFFLPSHNKQNLLLGMANSDWQSVCQAMQYCTTVQSYWRLISWWWLDFRFFLDIVDCCTHCCCRHCSVGVGLGVAFFCNFTATFLWPGHGLLDIVKVATSIVVNRKLPK